MHPGCARCEIRACAEEGGLLHCGSCAEFPCERITAFQNDGHVHHLDAITQLQELEIMGPDRWLADQQGFECSAAFSWHEEICRLCGRKLLPYHREYE